MLLRETAVSMTDMYVLPDEMCSLKTSGKADMEPRVKGMDNVGSDGPA